MKDTRLLQMRGLLGDVARLAKGIRDEIGPDEAADWHLIVVQNYMSWAIARINVLEEL